MYVCEKKNTRGMYMENASNVDGINKRPFFFALSEMLCKGYPTRREHSHCVQQQHTTGEIASSFLPLVSLLRLSTNIFLRFFILSPNVLFIFIFFLTPNCLLYLYCVCVERRNVSVDMETLFSIRFLCLDIFFSFLFIVKTNCNETLIKMKNKWK